MLIKGIMVVRKRFFHHTTTITITKDDGRMIHTNRGAPGMIRLRLPEDAPVGLEFIFCVAETFLLNVDPQEKTLFAANDAIPNKYYQSDGIGSLLWLCSDENGDWVVIAKSGNWVREA